MTTNDDEPNRLASLGTSAAISSLPVLAGLAGESIAGSSGGTIGSIAGGALVAVVAQQAANVQQRAIRMLEAARLQDVDRWREDPTHSELFVRAMRAACDSLAEERIHALAAVLRAVEDGETKVDDALVMVECLAQLDPVHIRAMQVMEDESTRGETGPERGWDAADPAWSAAGMSEVVVLPILRRLDASGLAYDVLHGAFGGGPVTYKLTDAGHKCLAYLRALPDDGP